MLIVSLLCTMFAFPKEAERMNVLLGEMRRSLEELTLGLDGALNM